MKSTKEKYSKHGDMIKKKTLFEYYLRNNLHDAIMFLVIMTAYFPNIFIYCSFSPTMFNRVIFNSIDNKFYFHFITGKQ